MLFGSQKCMIILAVRGAFAQELRVLERRASFSEIADLSAACGLTSFDAQNSARLWLDCGYGRQPEYLRYSPTVMRHISTQPITSVAMRRLQ